VSDRVSDGSLVQRAQRGEVAALDALAGRYRPMVMKIALRLTRNRADAEDATQEAMFRMFRALLDFRGESAFSSWLYRIALNSAKTALIERARRLRVFASAHEDDERHRLEPVDGSTPEALTLAAEIGAMTFAAVQALPLDQRNALALCQVDGLSYLEAARIMECPIGTVRSRVSRARQAIDQRLGAISAPVDCP